MQHAEARKSCSHCGKKKDSCADCTKKMQDCKVKDLVCNDSLAANAACKKCPDTVKKAGLVRQLQKACHSNQVKTAQNSDGIVWIMLTDEEEFPVTTENPIQPSASAPTNVTPSQPSASAPTNATPSQPSASAPAS